MTQKLLVVLFCCGLLSVRAQPVPKINSLSREWLQRGTSIELTIEGENLSGIKGFIFSGGEGLWATNVPPETPAVILESSSGAISTGEAGDRKVRAKLTISPEAALGTREFRMVTRSGVSNPVTVNVGYLPEILEQEANNSTNQAQWVELPVAVSGSIQEAADSDWFRFKARKDQRLIIDVFASRLGSALDSNLALYDLKGKELARSEDENILDSLIDFKIPEDGEYLLELRDFRYKGGGNFKYHLNAGEIPYLDGTFPFGGQRGQQVEVSLRGRNLGEVSKMKLTIDPQAPLGPQQIHAHTPNGFSNSRPFDVSDLPEISEQEPNNETNKAQNVSLPLVINGRIQGEKDVDLFAFKVEKNQRFVFEVVAQRFGSPLDTLLTLFDPKGKMLKRNDDAAGADARIDHTFGDAGEFSISIVDLLEREGDQFAYRLAARRPEPDFSVRFLPDNPRLSPGGHIPIRVEVSRESGFGGAVVIAYEKAPQGLSCPPVLIAADAPSGWLMIAASEQSPLGYFPLQLTASAVIDGKKRIKPAQPLSNDRPVKEAFLTVLEAPPFSLEVVSLSAQMEQNQSSTVDVIAHRRNGFNGEITLTVEGFSIGRDPISKSVEVNPVKLKPGEMQAAIALKAKLDSETGSRPIVIKGEAKHQGETVVQYSEPIPLAITPFPFMLANTLTRLSVTVLPPGRASAAGEALFTVKASRRGWFTDDIALSLEGLPAGIEATSTNIARNTTEASFTLTATEKAEVGKTNTFAVVGAATLNGQTFQQRTEPITLTVNAPEPVEEKPPAKVASP